MEKRFYQRTRKRRVNKVLFLICMIYAAISLGETLTPKTISQFKQTSVRIYNIDGNRGGTGAIFKSYSNASHILTNKHVCRLIEDGGIVVYNNKQYNITHYKKFQQHDLCLVRVAQNFNIDLEIENSLANVSSKTIVSGHPNLLPHIVTVGHLSERQDVSLVIGLKKCNKQDIIKDLLNCVFLGGKPVIQTLDAQLISNIIKPGNSGSAVFNRNGKIVGVVFAGNGRGFSYGYIVPQIYLYYFLQNAHRFEWIKVGTKIQDSEEIQERIFDYRVCDNIMIKDDLTFDKLKSFCSSVNNNLIWNK